ncbi:hypothetical protein GOBAR_DD11012 [Gossypium barbadense]|nr:hypothetical protein GOBAR_DD11012 [Gossypium barbadense]
MTRAFRARSRGVRNFIIGRLGEEELEELFGAPGGDDLGAHSWDFDGEKDEPLESCDGDLMEGDLGEEGREEGDDDFEVEDAMEGTGEGLFNFYLL